MSQKIVIDEQSKSLATCFAIIKTPRKSRKRYPEAIVEIVETEAEAHARSDESKKLYPAIVYGPSLSSESVKIFYLMKWLS